MTTKLFYISTEQCLHIFTCSPFLCHRTLAYEHTRWLSPLGKVHNIPRTQPNCSNRVLDSRTSTGPVITEDKQIWPGEVPIFKATHPPHHRVSSFPSLAECQNAPVTLLSLSQIGIFSLHSRFFVFSVRFLTCHPAYAFFFY